MSEEDRTGGEFHLTPGIVRGVDRDLDVYPAAGAGRATLAQRIEATAVHVSRTPSFWMLSSFPGRGAYKGCDMSRQKDESRKAAC